MKVTYLKRGDYQIPNLTVPDKVYQIGKYGMLHRTFLKEHHHSVYATMPMNGTLLQHLEEIDKTCNQYMNKMVSDMAKNEGATETLKASNQMEWVQRMDSIRNRAEEFVLKELVYGGFENEEI